MHTETSEINRVGVPRCHTPTELQYLLHIYAKLWLHLKLTSLVQNWRNLYYIKIVKRLKQRFAFLVCVYPRTHKICRTNEGCFSHWQAPHFGHQGYIDNMYEGAHELISCIKQHKTRLYMWSYSMTCIKSNNDSKHDLKRQVADLARAT